MTWLRDRVGAPGHSPAMRARLITGTVLLVLGCPAPALDGDEEAEGTGETAEESGETTETGDTTDETTDGGECLPPQNGVARTFDVDLLGFPEIQDDLLTSEAGLDFSGPCLLDSMDFDGATLTLGLSCEHPAPSLPEGATVSITTAATGIPAGVSVGDTLTFEGFVIESQGGVVVDPEFSLQVMGANVEVYQLRNEAGPIFAANFHGLGGDFEQVMVTGKHDCPAWQGCSSEIGTIGGYIDAKAGGESIDVHVGEVGLLDIGSMSWDVSLFGASFDDGDCHFGIRGSFSVVRRP